MSKIYTQHTVGGIFVSQTGHDHVKSGKDEEPFVLECEACEPWLVKEGWVYDPELIPLTDRQIREKDRLEREGNLAVKQAADAMGKAMAQQVASPRPTAVKEAEPKPPVRRRGRPRKQAG